MRNYFWFVIASFLEIAGCYATWAWLRLGRSWLWVFAGLLSLFLFSAVLTRVDALFAGRAYAAYGGIYIVASLIWLNVVERHRPSLTDLTGSALCIAGASLIAFGWRP